MVGPDIGKRRTAFPNMWLEEMSVETPPFDEEGVVQEFVGGGVTREFDALQKAGDVTEDLTADFIEDAEDMIGLTRDSFKIKYTLLVRVPIGNPFTERGVGVRARTWARAKNPFEMDVAEVSLPREDKGMSEGVTGDVYRVEVTMTK